MSGRALHEGIAVPVLIFRGETMVWKKKDKSIIGVIEVDNLRSLLGVKRIDRIPKGVEVGIKGVMKGFPGHFGAPKEYTRVRVSVWETIQMVTLEKKV